MSAVPVQFEDCIIPAQDTTPARNGICGTCTRCGRTHAEPISTGRGPVTAMREAKAEVLAVLTEACEHPLPWGIAPVHVDRGIPRGVVIFGEDHHGHHWPLSVGEKGKLLSVVGGCDPGALVLVVPESDDYGGSALEFAAELLKRGYRRVQRPAAGWQPRLVARRPAAS